MSETRDDLREALARCCDCQKALQPDEIEYYGDRCDACEWILQGRMEDDLPWPENPRRTVGKVISAERFAELVAAEAQVSTLQAEVERLQKVEGEREKGRVPDGTGLSPDGQTASRSDPSDFDPSRGRALLADLERELGVRGASAVFRKSLALAKKAAAAAREEVMPHDRRSADRTEGSHVDCPGEEVRARRGAQKILDGLNDALAFAQGDESRATLRAFIVEGGKVTEVSPPFDYALPKQAPPAQGTEARKGRDACGSVHDGPVAIGDAPSDNPLTETKEGSEHA